MEIFPIFVDFISAISVILGGIAGIFEHHLLRIIAFSGIVNISLLLIPLQIGDLFAIHSSLLFFAIYFIISLNLFSFLFAFRIKHSFFYR